MAEGDAREALLRVAGRLCVELGYQADGAAPGPALSWGPGGELRADALGPDDELLIATVKSGLTRLAAVLGAAGQPAAAHRLLEATLDGAEMTMRGELLRGRCERLPALLPSFVFLVALPLVHQNKAFELSQRTFELLEEARRF